MSIVYCVQIHPIYDGHLNDCKVLNEHEFDTFEEAKTFMEDFNEFRPYDKIAEWPHAIDTITGENL